MLPDVEALAEALGSHAPEDWDALPGRTNHLSAGVMVPILWDPRPTAIVTLRPAGMSQHGGEICFPGGRPDTDDGDLWATARREANEEMGITAPRLLGRLASMPLYTSDWRLVPFVAAVSGSQQELVPAADEVAQVLRMDIDAWLQRPTVDAIGWSWEGKEMFSPIFELDELVMYGATAQTFWELLEVVAPVFGRPLPTLEVGRWDWKELIGINGRRIRRS